MTGAERPCDVLIPPAMENAIQAWNADRIKANLVVEAANGPATFEADKVLRTRRITICIRGRPRDKVSRPSSDAYDPIDGGPD